MLVHLVLYHARYPDSAETGFWTTGTDHRLIDALEEVRHSAKSEDGNGMVAGERAGKEGQPQRCAWCFALGCVLVLSSSPFVPILTRFYLETRCLTSRWNGQCRFGSCQGRSSSPFFSPGLGRALVHGLRAVLWLTLQRVCKLEPIGEHALDGNNVRAGQRLVPTASPSAERVQPHRMLHSSLLWWPSAAATQLLMRDQQLLSGTMHVRPQDSSSDATRCPV